jgi:hypothetical protein
LHRIRGCSLNSAGEEHSAGEEQLGTLWAVEGYRWSRNLRMFPAARHIANDYANHNSCGYAHDRRSPWLLSKGMLQCLFTLRKIAGKIINNQIFKLL